MCLNKSEIRLKNGRLMYVSCGVCPACLQERANRRKALIQNERKPGYVTLFVTLTYDNRFVPYVLKSDFEEHIFEDRPLIPLYRDKDIRKVRFSFRAKCTKVFDYRRKKPRLDIPVSSHGDSILFYKDLEKPCGKFDEVSFDVPEDFDFSQLVGRRSLSSVSSGRVYKHDPNKVAVIYYKDIQNFFKRLKVNYERTFGKSLDFSAFYVSEYGPNTLRPHFHALITVKQEDVDRVQDSILQSWKYCDRKRLLQYIEVAKDASSYVSSYVNCHTYLPKVYFSKDVRPKSSHTKHYGFNNPYFSLDKVLEGIDKGDLHYPVSFCVQGSVYDRSFILPSYVLSQYFPKFKGYSKLSPDELSAIYSYPPTLSRYCRRLGYDSHSRLRKDTTFWKRFLEFQYSNPAPYNDLFIAEHIVHHQRVSHAFEHRRFYLEESTSLHDYIVNVRKLWNAKYRFYRDYKKMTGFYPPDDLYVFYALRAWSVRGSNVLKDSYLIPEEDRYLTEDNVNTNSYDIVKHNQLVEKFDKYDKSKRVNNYIYSQSCVNF